MKKYFFTTVLLAGLIAPAFADDTITTDKKITGGANTCTVDVLGVSDNNATANTIATWSLIDYECGAGQYLVKSETDISCQPCPIGSYCPGGKFTVESETNGANACPTDYTSDAGAVGENECYIGCELACSTNVECPPHSNNCTHSEFKTTGKQFSGGACNAYPSVCPVADFECDTGYRKEVFENIDEVTSSFLGELISGQGVLYDCSLDNVAFLTYQDVNSCEITPAGTSVFLRFSEVPIAITIELALNNYGKDTPGVMIQEYNPSLMQSPSLIRKWEYLPNAKFSRSTKGEHLWATISKIGVPGSDTELIYSAFLEYSGTGNITSETINKLQKSLNPDTWYIVMEYMNKVQSGYFSDNASAFAAFGVILLSTMQQVPVNLPWAYYDGSSPYDSASFVYFFDAVSDLDHVGTLYSEIDLSIPVSYCTANTIKINWNPDNGGASTQNMCMYDGAITVPDDPVRPGYTFTGWKLLENTTTE